MSLVRGKWPASHERGRLYAVSAPSVRRGIRPTSHCGRAALRGGRDVKIMRQERGSNGSIRSSALWGKPSKGETRSSALWGKGGRGIVALLAVAMMVTPMAAVAGSGSSGKSNGLDASVKAYLSPSLLRTAQLNPKATFNVIVQGSKGKSSAAVGSEVAAARKANPGKGVGLRKQFNSINGVAAQLTGRQIANLARRATIRSITTDAPVVLSGY